MLTNIPDVIYNGDDADALMAFWSLAHDRSHGTAALIFPEKPKGYVRATKDLAHYAANKATAVRLRLEGKIDRALYYESIAERIYNNLPEYAKW